MGIESANRIVVKVGTSSLTYENGKPNLRFLERFARTLADLSNRGKEIALVSSGAIAVGMDRMGLKARPTDTPGIQAAAAIGQCELMSLYDRFFSEYGRTVAQILLTRDVVEKEASRRHAINTFSALLKSGVIPVVNENDSVSVDEVVGDNDNLSALVAKLIGADALIIITDIEGLYDSDPRLGGDAKLIPVVEKITPELMENAGGAGTARGTGGMRSKLEAAMVAVSAGIDVYIISGKSPSGIHDIFDGKPVGTLFKKEDKACTM